MRTVEFQHITFTGGEPFLADSLGELVLAARLKGKGVTVISNGTVAKEGDYRLLADLGVSLFEFPLHAEVARVHDALTRVPGSFVKVLDSIRSVRESRSEVCVVFVLTRINASRLASALDFVESLGVKRMMLARFNIGGRGLRHVGRLMPSLGQLRDAFRVADDHAAGGTLRISSNVCVPHCVIDPRDYPHIPISSCAADVTRRPITVDFDGNVRVCNHSPVVVGNIHEQPIEEMFASAYVRSLETVRPGSCLDCRRWDECRGGCRAASEQVGKTIGDEDPCVAILKAPA